MVRADMLSSCARWLSLKRSSPWRSRASTVLAMAAATRLPQMPPKTAQILHSGATSSRP